MASRRSLLLQAAFFILLAAAAWAGAVSAGAAAGEPDDAFGESAESLAGVLAERPLEQRVQFGVLLSQLPRRFEEVLADDREELLVVSEPVSRDIRVLVVLAGIFSGANVWAARELARRIEGPIATVLLDQAERYFSTSRL